MFHRALIVSERQKLSRSLGKSPLEESEDASQKMVYLAAWRRPPVRNNPVESMKGVRRNNGLNFGREWPFDRVCSSWWKYDCWTALTQKILSSSNSDVVIGVVSEEFGILRNRVMARWQIAIICNRRVKLEYFSRRFYGWDDIERVVDLYRTFFYVFS